MTQEYGIFTDERLLAFVNAGDERAFAEVYNRYYALLLQHAATRLSKVDHARDVVQDVFVKFWEKRSELQVGTNLSGYLYVAVRNQIFDFIRHQKVIETYTNEMLAANTSNVVWADHKIREQQFAAMIETEIQALPPRMREVFRLRRQESLSTREVAERLGITENTATDQLKKATKILKRRIGLILALAMVGIS